MRQEEHNIQVACVRWFNLQYPQYRGLLFACPNGGNRNLVTAAKLKAEGVTPGVADLLLLVPRFGFPHIIEGNAEEMVTYVGTADLCCGLAIEMKTKRGCQSQAQKEWQKKVEAAGYRYVIVRSVEQFIKEINDYLNRN